MRPADASQEAIKMATRIVGKRLRYSVRDVLDEQAMAELVRQALAGQTDLGPVGANRLQTILWDDFGDQVLVYLDSVIVKLILYRKAARGVQEPRAGRRGPCLLLVRAGAGANRSRAVATCRAGGDDERSAARPSAACRPLGSHLPGNSVGCLARYGADTCQ